MRRPRRAAVTIACAVVLMACGNAEVPDDTGEVGAAPDASPEPMPDEAPDEAPDPPDPPEDVPPEAAEPSDEPAPPEGSVDDLDARVEAAVQDLAAEAGVDPADIEVVSAEETTWPDGSLGCPQPDGMYTQALVEGYRIVLAAGDEQVAYHGAAGANPFRCDRPTEPVDP